MSDFDRNSKFSASDRRKIYAKAAEVALEDSRESNTVFMCCCAGEAMRRLGLGEELDCNGDNLPEMFLFRDEKFKKDFAWMSEQLIDAGLEEKDDRNVCKHVALLLCAEMCR